MLGCLQDFGPSSASEAASFLHYDFLILPLVSTLKDILTVREQHCRRILIQEKFLYSFNAILLKLNDQLLIYFFDVSPPHFVSSQLLNSCFATP